MSFFSSLGNIVSEIAPYAGATAGFIYGGPGGAMAGYQAGKTAGGFLGGDKSSSSSGGLGDIFGMLTGTNSGSGGNMLTNGILSGSAGQAGAAALGANAQRNAGQAANALLDPYYQTGLGANKQIAALSGLGPNGSAGIESTLEGMPGYQFTKDQGLNAIYNQGSAMGLGSNSLQNAGKYASGLADTYYQNYFKNLLSLTDLGAETGNKMGQNTIGIGNAQAGAYQRGGNAFSNASMSNFAGNAFDAGNKQNGINNDVNSYFNNSANNDEIINQLTGKTMPFLQGAQDIGDAMPWLS